MAITMTMTTHRPIMMGVLVVVRALIHVDFLLRVARPEHIASTLLDLPVGENMTGRLISVIVVIGWGVVLTVGVRGVVRELGGAGTMVGSFAWVCVAVCMCMSGSTSVSVFMSVSMSMPRAMSVSMPRLSVSMPRSMSVSMPRSMPRSMSVSVSMAVSMRVVMCVPGCSTSTIVTMTMGSWHWLLYQKQHILSVI